MASKVDLILTNLPTPTLRMAQNQENDPMWRCWNREVLVGRNLLSKINEDLAALKRVCAGEGRITNDLRTLAAKINLDLVPDHWFKVYPQTTEISTTEWVGDFARRLSQLEKLAKVTDTYVGMSLQAGAIMFPEAFLTATRQVIAMKGNCSLEELEPVVDVVEKNFSPAGSRLRGEDSCS